MFRLCRKHNEPRLNSHDLTLKSMRLLPTYLTWEMLPAPKNTEIFSLKIRKLPLVLFVYYARKYCGTKRSQVRAWYRHRKLVIVGKKKILLSGHRKTWHVKCFTRAMANILQTFPQTRFGKGKPFAIKKQRNLESYWMNIQHQSNSDVVSSGIMCFRACNALQWKKAFLTSVTTKPLAPASFSSRDGDWSGHNLTTL